jgi:RNA polymerase sigma-70 factor (ECF subfamily)
MDRFRPGRGSTTYADSSRDPDDTHPATDASRAGLSPDDQRAFAALVREHEPVLHGIALRLCRDPAEARDLVQDALERALKGFTRLQPGSNARSWLASILRNRFIDLCRRGVHAPRQLPDLEQVADTVGHQEREPEPHWASITQEQLRTAVDSLAEEFRSVYLLHAIEGRSYVEIAERLGIPKATVGTRLLRARRKLRERLEPHLAGEED